jgi:rubrerythrin
MFNSLLDALGYMPVEQAYMQAVQAILKPLKGRWPEAVTAAIGAANGGTRLEAAGQTLCDALRAWENQVEKSAVEQTQTNFQKVSELEQRLRELEFSEKQKDERFQGMQQLLNNRNQTISEMAEKLRVQNVVIADQHQKLASIFGDADNSHDAQKLLS